MTLCGWGRSSSATSPRPPFAAFPDCEIAAVGADLQITFELRDLAETYPLLDRVRGSGASLVSSLLRSSVSPSAGPGRGMLDPLSGALDRVGADDRE
jgi:hypothetical protein